MPKILCLPDKTQFSVSGGREEKLAAIGETVNVASRIEGANKEAGTRLLISEALHQQVENEVEVSDFLRVPLRGTDERMSLYEVTRLTPEAEARLSAQDSRETMHFAGRQWTRLASEDGIAEGGRRVFELEGFDLSFYAKARDTSPSATPAPTCICLSSRRGTRTRPTFFAHRVPDQSYHAIVG